MGKTRRKTAAPKKRRDALADEPILEGSVGKNDIRLATALNWYNYLDIKDKDDQVRAWVAEYMEGRYAPDEVALVRRLEVWRIGSVVYGISRMINNGVQLDPEVTEAHDTRVRELVSKASTEKEETKKSAVILPFDRAKEIRDHIVGEFEAMIDSFVESGYKQGFSAYEHLTKISATLVQARYVADRYKPLLSELELLKSGNKELKEAYRLAKADINRFVEQVRTLVDDAERYAGNKKAAFKPRKRKQRDASQAVRGLKYLASYSELQLVSVDPSHVVGAKVLWTYNVKYRMLTRLVSSEEEGFSVGGSTLKGYDPDKSVYKFIRNPEKVLKGTLNGPALEKLMDSIKNRSYPANGRINENTILLRVVK